MARPAAECELIAKRLRSLEREELQRKGGFAKSKLHEIELATEFHHSGAKTLYGRLADLIEPEPERVCHDVGKYEFACSACGYMVDIYLPNYCPNCGAAVVYDD